MAYQTTMPQYGAGGAMQNPYAPRGQAPYRPGMSGGSTAPPVALGSQQQTPPAPTAPPTPTPPSTPWPGIGSGFTQDQWNAYYGPGGAGWTQGTPTQTPTPTPTPTPQPPGNPLVPPTPTYPNPSTFNPTLLGQTLGSRLQHFLGNPAPSFNESLFTGMGGQSMQGLQQLLGVADRANQSGLFGQAWDQSGGLMDRGGLDPLMGNELNQTHNLGGQWGNLASMLGRPGQTEGILGGIQGGLAGPSYAESGFRQMAGGAGAPSLTEQRLGAQQYGNADPAYQQMRERLADDVTTQSLAAFNNSGMLGSDANQEHLAEGLGSALGGMDLQNFYRGQDLQRQDIGAIEGMRQQGFGNQMGALGAADNARMGQLGQRLGTLGMMQGAGDNRFSQMMSALGGQQGALESSFGMGQTGINNRMGTAQSLGNLYSQFLLPGQTYQDVGGAYDANRQGEQMGNYDLFNRSQNADYNRMQEILGAFTGSQDAAGMGEQTPFWQTLLGTGLNIAGLFL